MTPSRRTLADTYPQLEAFFCGCLHHDFPEAHGDLAGAVAAFRRDASAAERRAVRREWNTYRGETMAATLEAIGEQLSTGLGSAWVPRRRVDLEALDALLSGLR
jgi:hypothetical protein